MKMKNYMTIGIFIVVIALGVGVAYYFDPGAARVVLGVDSVETNIASDTEILPLDDASSTANGADAFPAVAVSAPSPKKSSQKAAQNKSESAAAVVPAPTLAPQDPDIDLPLSQNIDDGVNGSSGDRTAEAISPSLQSAQAQTCPFPGGAPSASGKIILNEVAWMGSPSSSNAEWMEMKNTSAEKVDLSGWELFDAAGKIKKFFSAGDSIAPGGFMILARGSVPAMTAGPAAPVKIYSGDLANTGDTLAIMDARCSASDYLDASNGWPGGNNTTKATLERDVDGIGWHTSASPGGTPALENSAGPPPSRFTVSVSLAGSAAGATVASDPAGLACDVNCTGSFASGTRVTLTPAAGPNAAFIGWSGLCYSQATCAFAVTANISITAQFVSTLAPPPSGAAADTAGVDADADISPLSKSIVASSSLTEDGSGQGDIANGNTSSAGHVLVAAVQIAGASSSNDFVKLYNPTAAAIDMGGWKLHKKSQTGVDYSLKTFPSGSMIAAGQTFAWANSAGGFSEALGADVSSTETLSADNSVALMDPAGNIIDAVAWGTGSGQYGEGSPYATNPAAGQTLARVALNGALMNTDNNASDFTLR